VASPVNWQQYADLDAMGWSSVELEQARVHATKIGTAALMVVEGGHVVAAWGHISHPYKSASMRKSLYDATIGATQLRTAFPLDRSLAELGINDLDPLSEVEAGATFEQLMRARSGVYHPAAYETASNAHIRPERHSATPGSHWYYNNWDFNVVCTAFEAATATPIDEAFAATLAGPLGMQDFEPVHVFRWLEPRVSHHPAITFRLSARDLARIGVLYLNAGMWGDQRIVAADWIEDSTSAITTFAPDHPRGEGNGYGRMWWTHGEHNGLPRSIRARGSGGQALVLFPEQDLVIVHLADTDRGPGVDDEQSTELLRMLLAAKQTKMAKQGTPNLAPVRVQALSKQDPPGIRTDYEVPSPEQTQALVGSYRLPRGGLRLYPHEGRLFVQAIGLPLSDVELFFVSNGSLRSPIAGLVILPTWVDERVTKLTVTFRGKTIVGARTPPGDHENGPI